MTSTERRVIVPMDAFVLVCVEFQKLSDMLLKTAQLLNREVHMLPEECKTLQQLLIANVQVGYIERILKAILIDKDDDEPPVTPSEEPSGGTPTGNGGPQAHA